MADTSTTFHWADYLVFCLSLLMSLLIGVYFAIFANKTTQDFLMASKQGKVFPVAMSMLASFTSSIFIVGVPAEIYYNGTMFFFIGVGYIAFLIVGAHITSAYEYLERRFNYPVRVLGSAIFIVLMVLYLGTVLYGPALAFSIVLKIPMEFSVIGIGLICTFYTCIGGLKAVIWTDTLQMMIIYGGLIALIIMGSNQVGGMNAVWETATERGRIIYDEISPDPRTRHTWWTMTIGAFFQYISLVGANQTIVQRFLAVEKKRDSQLTLYVALAGALVTLCMVTILGLVLVKFYEFCDPILAGEVSSPDQVVPLFMMEVMGNLHGLPGLFSASVFAAALSTVSSAINSLAAVVLEDFIRPAVRYCNKKELPDSVCNWTSKGLACFFGGVTIGLSYVAPKMGSVLLRIALSIFGTAGGPLFGLFALGIFFPFVNSIGAAVGVIVSIFITYWINVGGLLYGKSPRPLSLGMCLPDVNTTMLDNMTTTWDSTPTTSMYTTALMTEAPTLMPEEPSIYNLYNVSYMWYGFISIWVAIIVGVIVSLLTCCRRGMEPIPRELLAFNCGFGAESEKKDFVVNGKAPSTGHTNLAFYDSVKIPEEENVATVSYSKFDMS